MNEFRPRRHRITILREIYIPFFDFSSWVKVCTTWAEIHDNRMITIRYQKNLFPGMHAVVGNERFEIVGVVDRPGKTRLVELHVSKIRAAADMPAALQR